MWLLSSLEGLSVGVAGCPNTVTGRRKELLLWFECEMASTSSCFKSLVPRFCMCEALRRRGLLVKWLPSGVLSMHLLLHMLPKSQKEQFLLPCLSYHDTLKSL